MRGVGFAAAVAAGGVLLLVAAAGAGAATMPKGGTVQIWVTPSPTGNGGAVVLTGAIGDYGRGENANAAGKLVSAKTGYKQLVLKKGTILVNLATLQKKSNNANPSMYNATTCSAIIRTTAPIQVLSGTGAYVGITGTIQLTSVYSMVLPRTKKGTCNTSNNANPLAFYQAVSGTGMVKYS